MCNKQRCFVLYFLILVFLNTLPINNSSSQLNRTYILELRADFWIHAIIFSPWILLNPFIGNIEKKLHWILIGICFAGAMEGLQYILPYRTFNINDLLANITGVVIGSIGFVFEKKMIRE